MIVTSFYKYVKIPRPESFRNRHLNYCTKLGIRGKVLVGAEGINGSVSGTPRQISKYKQNIRKNKLFKGVLFKDTDSVEHPFKKMKVKLKPEIVTFGKHVDMKKTAKHIKPSTLRKWMQNRQVVLLDARNNYESKIGKFTGAVTLNIDNFRDFPGIANKLKAYKQKKIVIYCTGGIRCEKASAFLKENGFSSVYQLEGGILKYIEQYPDSQFEGRCFVFDSRLSVPSGKKNSVITTCELCHVENAQYINCRNVKCDKMFICCNDCKQELRGTCSKKCRNLA